MEDQEIERGSTGLAIKVGFWYVFSSFLIKSMALITTPIFARIMGTEAYGEFSNFVSWRLIIMIIVGLELYNTLPRAYYDYKERFDGYASTIAIFGGVITFLCYIVFLGAKSFFLQIVNIPEQLIHILFISLFFALAKNVFITREKTLYHYKSVAAISFFDGIFPTLVSIAAVLAVSDQFDLFARVYGFYATSLLSGIFCFVFILWKGRYFKWDYCKYAIKLALPLLINYLTMYLLTNTNAIIAKKMIGSSATAVVSISGSMLNIVTVLFQATNGAITTLMMDKLEQKKYHEARRDSFFYIGFLTLIVLGTILLAPEVVFVLGGTQYAEAVVLIPALAVAALVQAVVSVLTTILTYDKNIVKTAVCTGAIAVLSIFAKVLLIPEFGIISLSYVNLAASIIMFLFSYIFVKKAGYGASFHLKGCFLLLAIALITMGISYYLYSHTVIRYALIAVILLSFFILAMKNKEKITKVICKFRRSKS